MPGTAFQIEVNPRLPEGLTRLAELAGDLWYSWDRPTRALFSRLDIGLWESTGHNPKAFLNSVDERLLLAAADDPTFIASYRKVLAAYDAYRNDSAAREPATLLQEGDTVAYFCAEFGFHDSLPIYSGGLGILAGDLCKAASDMRLRLIGVGLLYRQGYFRQTLDADGAQRALYTDADAHELPVAPVLDRAGRELRLSVQLPGREVMVKLWLARVGHVAVYLLDTDIEENRDSDRHIVHRLYGGDRVTRIEQEMILGVGGARALAALGIEPTAWHINEGHAAFIALERICGLRARGLAFDEALEAVAANSVFTTHTAVPAGHDQFADGMVRGYLQPYADALGVGVDTLILLGVTPANSEFNMTALAIRASRFHNGVSRIHGDVSARVCTELWPQIAAEENPLTYVTNGVHIPTFLADEWTDIFDRHLGVDWRDRLTDPTRWDNVASIPDATFWNVHQSLKAQLLYLLRHRIARQSARQYGPDAHIDRLLRLADPEHPNVLTIGFARRFATYKRAALLFEDLDWLREIMTDPARPVLLIFAGKAHPADQPGQELIKRIAAVAAMREFEGHILLLEGYDMHLARRLVSSVDVWLNTPLYPMEASGTSGMKAGINGVINLSVLDGWWAEGYTGQNGWALKPTSIAQKQARGDQDDARALYEILQDKVVPLYYDRTPTGHSPGWVAMAKSSMASVLPRFNATRMLGEYVARFYVPASKRWREYRSDDYAVARMVAHWKEKVRAAWHGVSMRRLDSPPARLPYGSGLDIELALRLNGLSTDDVAVELVFGRPGEKPGDNIWPRGAARHRFTPIGMLEPERRQRDGAEEHRYRLNLTPAECGKHEYRLRAYPFFPLLTHPLEVGLMLWL